MKEFKLKNGMTVIYEKRPSKSVAIEIMVKAGSNNETKKINGISHFIEHMLFEGTKNYASSRDLANEVEKFGGELNAYTSDERTAYHIKIIKKHFDIALKILGDIVFNPLFRDADIEKERKIILDEIKLVTDEPRFHQWIVFEKALFVKHPTRNPTYGAREAVASMTKKDILDYYHKYYIPNNMIVTVVGNVPGLRKKIERNFSHIKKGKPVVRNRVIEPRQTKPKKVVERKKLSNSYVVLGYKTPFRLDKDSYVMDVIKAVLGRGQSGRMFYEIRTKRGLAYEVGVHHEAASDYGFFAVYLGTDKKNITKIKRVILDEFGKLQDLNKEELLEAKEFIEGSHSLHTEDTYSYADMIGFWGLVGKASMIKEYIRKIKGVSLADVRRVSKKYLGKNYTLAMIEQK